MIDYGDREVMSKQLGKRAFASSISSTGSSEALADRAMYNYSEAGSATLYGVQELVNDYANEKVKLEEIKKEHLPESLQSLSLEELRETVERKKQERDDLRTLMKSLSSQRSAYISAQQTKMDPDGFDIQVVETLRTQAAKKGIELGSTKEDAKEPVGSEPESTESPKKSEEE